MPWLVRYPTRAPTLVDRAELRRRHGMWRFRPFLPLVAGEEPITLGEGDTPLLRVEATGARLGFGDLWVKDEGANPTGSFKARGIGAAVTRAVAAGAERFVLPDRRQRGGGCRRLRRPRADAGPGVRATRDAAHDPVADRRVRRRAGAARRPHRRLRARRRAPTPPRPGRSTSRRSASRTGSRARRRWAWNSRCNSAGRCRPRSFIRPVGDRPHRHVEGVRASSSTRAGCRASCRGCTRCRAPDARRWCGRSRRGPRPCEPWADPWTVASGLRVPGPLGGRLMLRALRDSGGGRWR